MGMPSEGSEGGIGTDWEVGTIVWVRRRNGSWWPGRILGQHELSASHLMSPRSGTPVKLLGREDASVDWYNLVKSKRVKAFRCGEFDACIEKAEAAQGMPIKKREKYARREDAIIHALELERQMLEGKFAKFGGSSSTMHSGTLKRELAVNFPPESLIITDDGPVPGKFRKVGLHVATKGKSLSTVVEAAGALFTNQGGNSDAIPRMRGLQDFGLQAVSKRKAAVSDPYESSKRSFLMDNLEDPHLAPVRDLDGLYDHGSKRSFSPSKSRRTLTGFNEDSKRKDRRRPLRQVLQSSAKLQVPPSMTCNGYADHLKEWSSHFGYSNYLEEGNAFSGLIDPYESELPGKLHFNPEIEEEEALLSNSGRDLEYENAMLHALEQDGSPNRKMGLSGRAVDKGDTGVSRWNSKGKRNIRKLSKRFESQDFERNIYSDYRGRPVNQGLYGQGGDSDDSDYTQKDVQFELGDEVGYQSIFQGSSIDYTDNSVDESDKESDGISLSGWDNEKLLHASRKKQWDEAPQQFDRVYTGQYHDRIESTLVDVNLKVQASYQGERVPLVSLMSRLNGKAIVGHPLQIEILNDGFTNTLLSDNESGGNPSWSCGTTAQPVWRTGRRSSILRIPRPHTASAAEGETGTLHYTDSDGRAFKRPLPVPCDDQTRLLKKTSHGQRPAKKSHKKSSKKVSLSNLKTRTLSSLAKSQKHAASQNKGGKLSSKSGSLSILMKPGETIPMVACVPVKVVFSRILEAVGRSPTNAMVHRHLLTAHSPDDKKPS